MQPTRRGKVWQGQAGSGQVWSGDAWYNPAMRKSRGIGSRQWERIRRPVLDRDNYQCQAEDCGGKWERMEPIGM